MAKQSKRKGKSTVGNRLFIEEEKTQMDHGKTLGGMFETFFRANGLEGLRPRTLKEHRVTFKYFFSFLEKKYPDIKYADEVTTEIIRDYVYYMSKESCQFKTDKKGLSPFTINIRLRTLKCFFKISL
ncbi:phage integrase SAM-like domain-containing protein [Neobacillus novalis]|uniref:Phage integrase SAM-like domain-containing protein n=1 Tax=Neobacillus novalis TaxID=220687 RepID=A0AA95SCR4_9BACI|nr:phage integrase SAM-like domain-containing protein [Neobacillus novalis]WHY88197.1 phage integrase SAM-like domain-containing protein [Neobacillus novalis]